LQKKLNDNRVINHLRNLRLVEKLLFQGLIVTTILIVIQAWLAGEKESFMVYLPPIGFAFYLAMEFFAQPLIVGAVNIAVINSLYHTKGWQVGFWLNGIFLLLGFSTLNLVLQTTFNLPFLPTVAVIDLLLAVPFGAIARFSNGGWKKPID
jgi:hypothetical protein